jgi:hypothetical protein
LRDAQRHQQLRLDRGALQRDGGRETQRGEGEIAVRRPRGRCATPQPAPISELPAASVEGRELSCKQVWRQF